MIAIILAGGRGSRMAPLTDTLPKPMLKVLDKNLLEWKLEALPESVTKVVFVVGYKKEVIMNYFGSQWKNIPITYIHQEILDGTAGAVFLCKEYVENRALILNGDDIYEKEDLENLVAYDYGILVMDQGEEGLKRKGQAVEKNGLLIGFNEGSMQTGTPSSLISTGAFIISSAYFDYPMQKWSDTEYGLPHTIIQLIVDFPIHVVKTTKWIQITTPECLERAAKELS